MSNAHTTAIRYRLQESRQRAAARAARRRAQRVATKGARA